MHAELIQSPVDTKLVVGSLFRESAHGLQVIFHSEPS
jgi:hypothetical protein